ncbi:hypothetical protein ACQP2C_31395 [Micromonospora zamorensis]|uniref:hypothetical protein n=1 Tax=Micromonospora zamorensis TaxID=709883 RepID=UPI003D980DC1
MLDPPSGPAGGGGGGLPITGSPILTIVAVGILLILIGMAALWRTRRLRWVVK